MNRPGRVEVGGGVAARLAGLTPVEKTVVALSVVAASLLLIDPLIYEVVRGFNPGVRRFFRSFTDLGKSSAILLPAAILFILLAALRTRDIGLKAAAAYGYLAQIVAFVFVSVALAGIAASLAKAVIGRARPKLFDTLGSFAFEPFAFSADFASFPSGHATSIFALGGGPGPRLAALQGAAVSSPRRGSRPPAS